MTSVEEKQLDLLIAAVTNYNQSRVPSLSGQQSLVEVPEVQQIKILQQQGRPPDLLQQELINIQQENSRLADSLGMDEDEIRSHDLSVDEIQRILDLPASALYDISTSRYGASDDVTTDIPVSLTVSEDEPLSTELQVVLSSNNLSPESPQVGWTRHRSVSSTNHPSSPESGISGCAQSPKVLDAGFQSPEFHEALGQSPGAVNTSGLAPGFANPSSQASIEPVKPEQSVIRVTVPANRPIQQYFDISDLVQLQHPANTGLISEPVNVRILDENSQIIYLNQETFSENASLPSAESTSNTQKSDVITSPTVRSHPATSVPVVQIPTSAQGAYLPPVVQTAIQEVPVTVQEQTFPRKFGGKRKADSALELDAANREEQSREQVECKVENPGLEEYFCYVCGDKAGKHSYYGGQVCASCRAFFRRSVQSKYYELFVCKREERCEVNVKTRKNCQFCRFKKCLDCGMKVSWVLSDDERNRRFNKFNKVSVKPSSSLERFRSADIVTARRIPQPYMGFTIEEEKVLQEISQKFAWCRSTFIVNLLTYNREACANFLAAAFSVQHLQYKSWLVIEDAFKIYFVNSVVPQFPEVDVLPFYDRSLILNGDNPRIAHTFKTAMCMGDLPEGPQKTMLESHKGESYDNNMCLVQKQMKEMTENKELLSSLGLEEQFSKINLDGAIPKLPQYRELFHPNWANNPKAEERHKEITYKLRRWPIVNEQFDYNMALVMTVILLFSPDSSAIIHRDKVETVQLKYILLLQRYLKSKFEAKLANKKFLEGMLLISYSRELWELQKLHVDK